MKFITSLLALPALALATKPSPEQITIKSVTHSGNGCPQGSTSTTMNEDKTVRHTILTTQPPPPQISLQMHPH